MTAGEHVLQVGLGLWSMRSTAYAPASWTRLYDDLQVDARLAEELGFDSLWVAEHHFWYDGWCPQPLVAASTVLAATGALRVGTAMYLLPQHDIAVAEKDVATLLNLYGNRLDLGVSLGYRDEEYDGVGLARANRGSRMEHHLSRIVDRFGDFWPSPPPVWIGGIAEPAIRRAGKYGASLLLPNSLRAEEIVARRDLALEASSEAGLTPGRVGVLVDIWITDDEDEATRGREHIVTGYREYAGAWFRLRGEPGFRRPDLLDKQSARTRKAAIVGSPDTVTERLLELRNQGVSMLVLGIRHNVSPAQYRDQMRRFAEDVLPNLRGT